ncbi:MAG: MMPL family transporter [Deltaproteobacteria bacterium]|nr:MMPL family transporter [Candidatus Zymogenaceae bacterium]
MRERLLKFLAQTVYRYDIPVLLLAALVSVLSLFGVFRLGMVSNVASMLPEGNEAVGDYVASMERMGTLDYLVVMCTGEDVGTLTAFSDEFASRIEQTGMVGEIRYRIEETDRTFFLSFYLPRIFLFLTESDFIEIEERLTRENIDKALTAARMLLVTPASSGAGGLLITKDPLGFLSVMEKRFMSGEGGFRMDTSSGYFLSSDHKHLLMLVRPNGPPQDTLFGERLLSEMDRASIEAATAMGHTEVTVSYAGGYVIAVNDARTIKRDLIATMITSMILVLACFYLIFRRLRFLLFVGTSLGLGIFWTLGFAGWTMGHLNMVTAAFGAILVGLGIDFSIHFYNRLVEEEAKGLPLQHALTTALSQTGVGISTGAVTTSIAFFGMAFTRFKGLSELGVLGGVGILMTLLTTFTVLPALIVRARKIYKLPAKEMSVPLFGMERLAPFIQKHRGVILCAAAVLTAFMGWCALGVGFSTNMDELRPDDGAIFTTQENIWEIFSGSSSEIIVTVTENDLETALVASEGARSILLDYVEVSSVEGPEAWLPSVKRQRENLSRTDGLHLDAVLEDFKTSRDRLGFSEAAFSDFEEELQVFADGGVAPITITDLEGTPGMEYIQKYIGRDGDTWRVTLFAYPQSGVWTDDIDRTLVARLKKTAPDVEVASISLVLAETRKIVTRDFILATIIAAVGVFFALLIQFRNIRTVCVCMLSLGCGVVWMLGCMKLLGVSLNFANVVAAPMVVGIGIDDNIHLFHRFMEKKNGKMTDALVFSGRAVIMTSVTTVLGFGSLVFARYGGLTSIGMVSVLGVTLCLVSSLFITGALMAVIEGRRDKEAPSEERERGGTQ